MIKEATQLKTVEKDLAKAGINIANKPVIMEAKPEPLPAPPKPVPKKTKKAKAAALKKGKSKNKDNQ